ncbi:MAG: TRAP transporter small permease subunit [Firmicutes bacterium]|nr:TRAP transporter small permease subunit [Bacillota bacterium]
MGLMENHVMQKNAVAAWKGKVDAVGRLERISLRLNRGLAWVAGGSLLAIVFLVVGNALLRAVWKPLAGTPEMVGWLASLTIGFGLGYTQVSRGYVEIEALVERLPRALQRTVRQVVLFAGMTFFLLVSWEMTGYGLNVMKNGNLSETMWLPFYPLIFLLSLGFAGLTLALFVDFLKERIGGAGK